MKKRNVKFSNLVEDDQVLPYELVFDYHLDEDEELLIEQDQLLLNPEHAFDSLQYV